jgi:hypothetical protein
LPELRAALAQIVSGAGRRSLAAIRSLLAAQPVVWFEQELPALTAREVLGSEPACEGEIPSPASAGEGGAPSSGA